MGDCQIPGDDDTTTKGGHWELPSPEDHVQLEIGKQITVPRIFHLFLGNIPFEGVM